MADDTTTSDIMSNAASQGFACSIFPWLPSCFSPPDDSIDESGSSSGGIFQPISDAFNGVTSEINWLVIIIVVAVVILVALILFAPNTKSLLPHFSI